MQHMKRKKFLTHHFVSFHQKQQGFLLLQVNTCTLSIVVPTAPKNRMQLTKRSLLKHCRDMDMYSTPELNERLYLHQKGICKIENLDEYTGVKVLWLQQNCIDKIEGLSHLVELRHLYLNENMIQTIDGERAFQGLTRLDTLNLEKNNIASIGSKDLCHLSALNTLHLAQNKLSNLEDLEGLLQCPSLCCLDLRNNGITVTEDFINNILCKLPNLRVLYLMSTNNLAAANEIGDDLPNYRKTVISKCTNLRHLDDRPVFEDERRCCTAWARDGIEGERKERLLIRNEKKAKQEANHAVFAKLVEDAKKSKAAKANKQQVQREEVEGNGSDDDEKVH